MQFANSIAAALTCSARPLWRPFLRTLVSLVAWGFYLHAGDCNAQPLRLDPANPRYFQFRGRPTILIGSTEHYGAVLNRDFDYVRYLDTISADGLNLTRTFAGTYWEVPSSFGIVDNTLAPPAASFICPWPRAPQPGSAEPGLKFDLSEWNEAYFDRLRDFVAQASKRGIVVELVLFSAIYDEHLWAVNPMNPANNVNEVGPLGREQVYSDENERITNFQLALVAKLAAELRDADNVYFETCNEPYFGAVAPRWNDRVVQAIAVATKDQAAPRLIAQNIANGTARIEKPNPLVSIFNFHYASPPDCVADNLALARPIADDETGFHGTGDAYYRAEAWEFVLAGGAAFDHLDYSFSVAHPDGTLPITTSPGGGGPVLRKQFALLKKFLARFDFCRMKPANGIVLGGTPDQGSVRVLAESGEQYACYVRGGTKAELRLELPANTYRAEWVDTKTGAVAEGESFSHSGGSRTFVSPDYTDDIALRIWSQ